MKNSLLVSSAIFLFLSCGHSVSAQCSVTTSLSSATNGLGIIDNRNNPVSADKDLNAIAFVHRHQVSTFGGNSGNLRYDVSTNGGSTWTSNLGVLNPLSTWVARYPNNVLYNPPGNTNPANAYMGYLAVTLNTVSGVWNGVVSGASQLSGGGGSTEAYNQPASPSYLKAMATTKGAPGVFWALDMTSTTTGNFTGGIQVYKGVWSSSGNTVNWSLNTTITPPYNPNAGGIPFGHMSIAFDPTGNLGWICMVTDVSTSSSVFALSPVFYRTTNGGSSWTGPISVNLNTVSCVAANISFGGSAGIDTQCNLAVDVNGNPHMLAIVGENTGYDIDPLLWHCAMDVTYDGTTWNAYDVSGLNQSENLVIGSVSNAIQDASPQMARSADGKKIFFSWSDNSFYTVGTPNTNPDLFARAYDVQLQKWTQVKNFSACNSAASGRVFFPHVAREVLEPSAGVYKMIPVYAEFSTGDLDQNTNFEFLDNCTFSAADFSITPGNTLALNVTPGPTALLCPGNFINLQLTGVFSQILWSNGNTSNDNYVNTTGIHSVTATSGCASGTAAVTVTNLSVSVSSSSLTICNGGTVSLNATGNAYSYTWFPGIVVNSVAVVSPTENTIFFVLAQGDGCVSSASIAINVNPSPTVLIVSNHSLTCAGEEVVLQALGTSVYVWNTGATTPSISVKPTVNTTYTVTGYNSNGCSASYPITQLVNPRTSISSVSGEEQAFGIYPNPNTGNFLVKAKEPARLNIINELGQKVSVIELTEENNYTVTLNSLASGVYFITGTMNGKPVRQKIVVSR